MGPLLKTRILRILSGLTLLTETITATTARAAGTEWAGFAADLDAAVIRLTAVTALWRRTGVYDVLAEHYDHLVVYGNAAFYDPVRSYELPPAVAARTPALQCEGTERRNAEHHT